MRGIPLVEGVKKRGRGIEEVEKWKRERERNSRGREIVEGGSEIEKLLLSLPPSLPPSLPLSQGKGDMGGV